MTAMTALIGFAMWTMLLIVIVFLYRGLRFVTGTPINAWPRTAKPATDMAFIKRVEDAHANCLENLPLFAVIVLAAVALNKPAAVESFAAYVLYARIAQSLVHLLGTSQPLVLARASFWTVQLVLFALMFKGLLT